MSMQSAVQSRQPAASSQPPAAGSPALLADLEALLDQAGELLDEQLVEVLAALEIWLAAAGRKPLDAQQQAHRREVEAWIGRTEDWFRTLRLARVAIIRAQARTAERARPTSDLCVGVAP